MPRKKINAVHKLEEHLRRKSPLKAGLKVKNEDDALEDYSKIINRLYLGNMDGAKNKDFFKKKHIKAVLNCTRDIPNYFTNVKDSKGIQGIEYLRIPVEDSLKEKDIKLMYEFMPLIAEFLYKHINILGHNVYVHCYAKIWQQK